MMSKYKRGAVGGTFDILHIGHKHLLQTSFQISDEVVIGVTSDNFVNKLNKSVLNNYDVRTNNIRDFIDSTFSNKYDIYKLDDYFGPASFLENIDVIILTSENSHRLDSLNNTRQSNGLKPLHGEIIELLNAKDGLPISTTRIKKGIIDSDGNSLI
tara:strand:+ start:2394 stop:2861 length:468 start_codon:yes stop_codon:yes gene_type:complete